MAIHSRVTPVLAVIGALALGGASAARAQEPTNAPPKDTSAASQSDTSGYRGYQNRTDSTRTDSSGFKYNGPPTDTTLKAEPGAQTGPSAGDTGSAARAAGAAGMADTVACRDGSNAAKAKSACGEHGGIDWAATRAAMKARGRMSDHGADTATASADTGEVNSGAAGYQYNGASTDTALQAKPGTQTGADTSVSPQYKSP